MGSTAISVFSALISGLIGVLVGTWLNRYYEVRRSKTDVLKTLVTYRNDPLNLERTNVLNCIPIIFCKDVRVCQALDKFKEAHDGVTENITNPMVFPQKYTTLNDSYIKLIEEIAKSLGLGSSLSWDKLKNPYIPKSFMDSQGMMQWY